MARDILVVDDNETIVEVLSAYLEAEGFSVRSAGDGQGAIAAVDQRVPDLALLDIMLPGIDGIELTRRFQRGHDIPVILVTARTEEIDRLIGLEIGADDYITKPFSPREVVARVRAVLRRAAGPRPGSEEAATIEVGGLTIDPMRRTVTADGTDVPLTRTEFDLLVAMAAHPGRVFTRMQLLEVVTGEAFEAYERTIDAHIKNIRKKLEPDPRTPRYLHTVIGVGYKVESR